MSVNDLLDLLEDLVNENTKPGFSGKCVLKSKDILFPQKYKLQTMFAEKRTSLL